MPSAMAPTHRSLIVPSSNSAIHRYRKTVAKLQINIDRKEFPEIRGWRFAFSQIVPLRPGLPCGNRQTAPQTRGPDQARCPLRLARQGSQAREIIESTGNQMRTRPCGWIRRAAGAAVGPRSAMKRPSCDAPRGHSGGRSTQQAVIRSPTADVASSAAANIDPVRAVRPMSGGKRTMR